MLPVRKLRAVNTVTRAQLTRERRQQLAQIKRRATAVARGCTSRDHLRVAVERFFASREIAASIILDLDPHRSIAEVMAEASAIDPFLDCAEPVHWFGKPGRNQARPICSFGPIQTVRHKMIKYAVEAQLIDDRHFFDLRGRGASNAVIAIAHALEGRPFILTADIQSCFQSINVDALYELQLIPPEVVRYALDYRHLPIERREGEKNHADLRSTSKRYNGYHVEAPDPRGLLQGSPASNAFLRHLLSRVVRGVAGQAHVFLYVDNFFVVAGSDDVCGQIKDGLVRQLADCSLGPLHLGSVEISHICDGVEVLGYHLMAQAPHGLVNIALSDKNLAKLEHFDECSTPAAATERDRYLKAFPALSSDFLDHARFPL